MKTTWTSIIDGEAPPFVATSTLAAATPFNPLRGWVLAWVDRGFYRKRFDSERGVQHLAGRGRGGTGLGSIVDEALAAISENMQPNSVGVWLKKKDLSRTVSRSTSGST